MNKKTGKILAKQIDRNGNVYTKVKSVSYYTYDIRKDISIGYFGVSNASRFFKDCKN